MWVKDSVGGDSDAKVPNEQAQVRPTSLAVWDAQKRGKGVLFSAPSAPLDNDSGNGKQET